jgi:putative glutathione S-transferase
MLWNRKKEVVVSNESSIIMRKLEESFGHLLLKDRQEVNCPGGGLYLEIFRPKIKTMNEWIHRDINTCVYDVVAATD